MQDRELTLPARFDLLGLREFLNGNDLRRDSSISRLRIDNSRLTWIEPVGLAGLAAAICHLRHGNETRCALEFTSRNMVEFLQRMDVFRRAGVALHEDFRRWGAGGRFVELSAIESFSQVDPVANQLMRVLPEDRELRSFFHYCLTELMNNACQHAASELVSLTCAQVWRGGRMEGQIAVCDCGIGLKAGLELNPALRPANDLEAITMAMRPWTSGRAHLRGPYAEFGTKGNGLFMVRRLLESVGGRLVIASKTALQDLQTRTVQEVAVAGWPGTLVGVQFPLRLPAGWLDLLRPIWHEVSEASR